MNRIDRIFAALRADGGRALMPFVTAGDPDLETTAAILPALQRAGAHVCELGIAYSDPIADGPVIQASMARALDRHVRPSEVFDMVEHLRADLDLGLVAMVSYSIIMRIGAESYVARAAQAGFDGLIVPDLPLEQADAVCEAAGAAGLVCSLLVAPTTPDERVERIARRCSGFVYVLGHAGLTGERTRLSADLRPRIEQVRNVTDLPIAVGFGVSGPDQVKQVVEVADAAIVGSAIVRRIEEHRDSGPGRVVEEVERFVGTLAAGL